VLSSSITARFKETGNGYKALQRHLTGPKENISFIAVLTVPLKILFVLICLNSNYKRNGRCIIIIPLPTRSVFVLWLFQTHRHIKYTGQNQKVCTMIAYIGFTKTAEHQTV
jgi:hypothetical protein